MRKGLLILLAAYGLFACSKSDELDREAPDTKARNYLWTDLDDDTLRIASSSATTLTFNIESNMNWTISPAGTADWEFVSVSPLSGSGDKAIQVSVSQNTGTTRRVKELVINGTNGNSTAQTTVFVTQDPPLDRRWRMTFTNTVPNYDRWNVPFRAAEYTVSVSRPRREALDAAGNKIFEYASEGVIDLRTVLGYGPNPAVGLTVTPATLPCTGGTAKLVFAENTTDSPRRNALMATYDGVTDSTAFRQVSFGTIAPAEWRVDLSYGGSEGDFEHIPGQADYYGIRVSSLYRFDKDGNVEFAKEGTVNLRVEADTVSSGYELSFGYLNPPTSMSYKGGTIYLFLRDNEWGRPRSGYIVAECNGVEVRKHFTQLNYQAPQFMTFSPADVYTEQFWNGYVFEVDDRDGAGLSIDVNFSSFVTGQVHVTLSPWSGVGKPDPMDLNYLYMIDNPDNPRQGIVCTTPGGTYELTSSSGYIPANTSKISFRIPSMTAGKYKSGAITFEYNGAVQKITCRQVDRNYP